MVENKRTKFIHMPKEEAEAQIILEFLEFVNNHNDWDYNVTVTPSGQVTVQGYHDGFPNHEIYKRVDSGTHVELYRFSKQTLNSLFPPMEHSVNVTV